MTSLQEAKRDTGPAEKLISDESFRKQVLVKNRPPFVNGLVPFAQEDNPEATVEVSISLSRRYEASYLRWQLIRHIPRFVGDDLSRLTGFEPYFIGLNLTPNEIAEQVSQIGKAQLDKLSSSIFREKVYQMLNGESFDLSVCLWLNGVHGSLVAKLKAQTYKVPQAATFRDLTRNLFLNPNPRRIDYSINGQIIENQQYFLPGLSLLPELSRQDQYNERQIKDPSHSYGFMWYLGKVGHPIVRTLLGELGMETLLFPFNF